MESFSDLQIDYTIACLIKRKQCLSLPLPKPRNKLKTPRNSLGKTSAQHNHRNRLCHTRLKKGQEPKRWDTNSTNPIQKLPKSSQGLH